jgi:hypothetical protein
MQQQQNKKQNRNKMTKPQTNTFSKYCQGNIKKKFDIKYTQIIQGPHNKQ